LREHQYEFSILLQTPLSIPTNGRIFYEIETKNNSFEGSIKYCYTTEYGRKYQEENIDGDVVFFDILGAYLSVNNPDVLNIHHIICYIKADI